MTEDDRDYLKAIKERICAVCIEQRDDGTCGLPPGLDCAIEEHLPALLDLLQGVSSDTMSDYVDVVRANVCSVCTQGDEKNCDLREAVECTLDRYLELVVEAIEDVRREADGDAMASA